MGAYKYLQELWKKKQSEVLRFVSRIRNWEYRQLPAIHRASKPSRIEKARRLGYRASGDPQGRPVPMRNGFVGGEHRIGTVRVPARSILARPAAAGRKCSNAR